MPYNNHGNQIALLLTDDVASRTTLLLALAAT